MNGIELAGRLLGDLHKFCGNELEALSFKSPDYFTSQMPVYAVRLDNN